MQRFVYAVDITMLRDCGLSRDLVVGYLDTGMD